MSDGQFCVTSAQPNIEAKKTEAMEPSEVVI